MVLGASSAGWQGQLIAQAITLAVYFLLGARSGRS